MTNEERTFFLIVHFLLHLLLLLRRTHESNEWGPNEPINVIFMLADGFGPASETFARSVFHRETLSKNKERSGVDLLEETFKMPLDEILKGTVRTCSSDSLITDSAAAATAYACGIKTYNGAIGVDENQNPHGTILEAAKEAGMLTGLIATNKITDATPASFSAHVPFRSEENMIAEMQIGEYCLGSRVDLLMGGGLCHFLPKSHKDSCRIDEKDLISAARNKKFHVIQNKAEFDQWNPGDNSAEKIMALLAKKTLAYDIDRNPMIEPSLAEMTAKALEFLQNKSSNASHSSSSDRNGFFLMIEGSRIDVAAHSNDSAAHYRDILAYQKAVEVALEFIEQHPKTLLISLSDHETGGLTLGLQHENESHPDYMWDPSVIYRVKKSSFLLSKLTQKFPVKIVDRFIKKSLFPRYLGITDAKSDEIHLLKEANSSLSREFIINRIINTRARIGWTTHGHTAVDVNLYAAGYKSDEFEGNFDNTEISQMIAKILHLDMKKMTEKLRICMNR